MKASSSSHQCQIRSDDKSEQIMKLGFDSIQLLLCSKLLGIPGNYFKFQSLQKGLTATFCQ